MYLKVQRLLVLPLMAAGLTMMSSCSDDDPSYAQDILFQLQVQVLFQPDRQHST
jgi:hypothetical protein